MIAKAVVEMNKKDPKDIDFVYDQLAKCELIGNKAIFVKVQVYPLCMEGEFKKYYEEYMTALKYDME